MIQNECMNHALTHLNKDLHERMNLDLGHYSEAGLVNAALTNTLLLSAIHQEHTKLWSTRIYQRYNCFIVFAFSLSSEAGSLTGTKS